MNSSITLWSSPQFKKNTVIRDSKTTFEVLFFSLPDELIANISSFLFTVVKTKKPLAFYERYVIIPRDRIIPVPKPINFNYPCLRIPTMNVYRIFFNNLFLDIFYKLNSHKPYHIDAVIPSNKSTFYPPQTSTDNHIVQRFNHLCFDNEPIEIKRGKTKKTTRSSKKYPKKYSRFNHLKRTETYLDTENDDDEIVIYRVGKKSFYYFRNSPCDNPDRKYYYDLQDNTIADIDADYYGYSDDYYDEEYWALMYDVYG